MSVNGREPVEEVLPVREVVLREVSVAIFRIAWDAEKDCCLLEVHDVGLLYSLWKLLLEISRLGSRLWYCDKRPCLRAACAFQPGT